MVRVGCHVSIRGGYLGAAKTAWALGATSFQYFPKNPRTFGVKTFDPRDAEACRAFCAANGLISIAHTSYPTNLAVDDPTLRRQTVQSVRNDLQIAHACGSLGVVVHFGQYKGSASDPLHGYRVMIETLNDILADWSGDTLLLLENNAGQGVRMGTTLEELVQIRSLVARPDCVGFCLDTCHLFASGYWTGDNWAEVAQTARHLGYFDSLKAVHLNDSRYPSGSFRDRHARIGEGRIGAASLAAVLQTPELEGLPVVLETPRPADGSHQAEIAFVRDRLAAGIRPSVVLE